MNELGQKFKCHLHKKSFMLHTLISNLNVTSKQKFINLFQFSEAKDRTNARKRRNTISLNFHSFWRAGIMAEKAKQKTKRRGSRRRTLVHWKKMKAEKKERRRDTTEACLLKSLDQPNVGVWILSGRGRFLHVTSIGRSIVQLRSSIQPDIRSAWSIGFPTFRNSHLAIFRAPPYIFQYAIKRGQRESRTALRKFQYLSRENVFSPCHFGCAIHQNYLTRETFDVPRRLIYGQITIFRRSRSDSEAVFPRNSRIRGFQCSISAFRRPPYFLLAL